MQTFAAAAIGLLIGASIFVAVRLLVLYRRTSAWPELLLGAMLMLSVGVGYPLGIAASRATPEWAAGFQAVSDLAISVGFSLLFVFTWRVFRPQATWARVLTAAGVIALLGKAIHTCVELHARGMVDLMDMPMSENLMRVGPIVVAYVWTAWESLRYHAVMRRRAKLGLADVAVSDRFLLWGLMAMSATCGVALNTGAVALHVDVLESPLILVCSSVTGLAQTLLLVLAFVPPRSYLAWVRARAAAGAD